MNILKFNLLLIFRKKIFNVPNICTPKKHFWQFISDAYSPWYSGIT